jgi:hypothetical protein
MHTIDEIPESQVVVAFLHAEIDSPTRGKCILPRLAAIGRGRKLIDVPIYDDSENKLRSDVLGRTSDHGYRAGLFIHFPETISWQRAVLNRQELDEVRYINHAKWLALSGDTGKASDAANRINHGFQGSDLLPKILATANLLSERPSAVEIILVSIDSSTCPVTLEGNTRLTAYLMQSSLTELSVIIGFSPELTKWLKRRF